MRKMDLRTLFNLCSVNFGNGNKEWTRIGNGNSDGNGNDVWRNLIIEWNCGNAGTGRKGMETGNAYPPPSLIGIAVAGGWFDAAGAIARFADVVSVFVARVAVGVSRARAVIAVLALRSCKPATVTTRTTDVLSVLKADTLVVVFGTSVIAVAVGGFNTDTIGTRARNSDVLSVLVTGPWIRVLKAVIAVTVVVRWPRPQYACP